MDIFMYQIEAQFKDTTKPQISVVKLVADERPKTYKVKDCLNLSGNAIRHFYHKTVIDKELIGVVHKTVFHGSGKSYTMYVFEDTEESRQKFLDTVADKVSEIADTLKADYTNYSEYWKNVRALDTKRW